MKKKIKLKIDTKPRDTWIPETWRYNGAGTHKNEKLYNRKRDKKKIEKDAFNS